MFCQARADVGLAVPGNSGACNNHDVGPGQLMLTETKTLADPPFQAMTLHSITGGLA